MAVRSEECGERDEGRRYRDFDSKNEAEVPFSMLLVIYEANFG